MREGGSILVGLSTLPTSLDPALATDPVALQALWAVHTPLITYRHEEGKEGTELVPALAQALPAISDDGLTYVMRLRRGLRYSNGTPIRVDDFKRAIERVRLLGSPLARLYQPIRSIVVDERSSTIRVTLRRPDPVFSNVLALPSSAPAPRSSPLIGVGPYRVAGISRGRRAVLTRVRGFDVPGVPAGHVDKITLTTAGGPGRLARGIITGSLDVMEESPPIDLLPEIRSKYHDRYREDPTVSSVLLVPERETPLDDPAVRRAIGESLDFSKLVPLYNGLLQPSCNVLPAMVPGYKRVDPCPYGDLQDPPNLVGATRQIGEAGATGASVGVRSASGVPIPVAHYVTRGLRKIGLNATLGRRSGPVVRLERIAPLAAHPAAFLERFASTPDSELGDALAKAMADVTQNGASDDAWAAADDRVVTEGYAVALGSERRSTFLSERLDADNCERINPLFGLDLSSLCLK